MNKAIDSFFRRAIKRKVMKTLRIEAVVQRCSVKKMFLKNLQNSQEKSVPESLF